MLLRVLGCLLLSVCVVLPVHAERYIGSIFFGGNSTALSRSDKAQLHEWLPALRASQAQIYLSGYTEAASPNGEMNRHVALGRAKIVADFLVSNGISKQRLLVAGKPDCCYPLLPTFNGPPPKYPNRRTDILLGEDVASHRKAPPPIFTESLPPLATVEPAAPLLPIQPPMTGNVFYHTDDPAKLDHPDNVNIRTGRYTIIKPQATEPQRKLLRNVVSAHLPPNSQIIDAVIALLRESGYTLATGLQVDPAQRQLLAMPLPKAHRKLGPITLEAALQVVAGKAFRLVVDPIHRLVSFELNGVYRPAPKRGPVLLQRTPVKLAKPEPVCEIIYRAGQRRKSCTTPEAPPPRPPPVDLITQEPRRPCPPLGDGPLERDLTVAFTARKYFLVDGETCTPWQQ